MLDLMRSAVRRCKLVFGLTSVTYELKSWALTQRFPRSPRRWEDVMIFQGLERIGMMRPEWRGLWVPPVEKRK